MNQLKLVFALSLVSIQSYCSQEFTFKRFAVMSPQKLGKVSLSVNAGEYSVLQAGKSHKIENHDVDPVLRKMNTEQLAKFQKNNSVAVNQLSDGSFKVDAKLGLKGGGVLGATIGAWIGKGLVYIGAYSAIGVISACTFAAAPVTFAALTAAWAVPIEAASMAGAVAGGMVGGVATGPV